MSVTIDRKNSPRTVCTITVDAQERENVELTVLQRLSAHVEIRGFRKGFAPLDAVRGQINEEALLDDVIRTIARSHIPTLIKEQGIVPLIPPRIEVLQANPLTLAITFVEKPTVKIKKPDKLAPAKKAIAIMPTEVQAIIDGMLEEHRTAFPVDRPVAMHDRITLDFSGAADDGTDIPGFRGAGQTILVGSAHLLPGFEEALIGMTKGSVKTFPLALNNRFPVQELRGKTVRITATVGTIEATALPELTDTCVQEKFGAPTKADLEERVKNFLQHQAEMADRASREKQFLDALVKGTDATIPDELIDHELQSLIDEWQDELKKKQTTIEEELVREKKSADAMEKEFRIRAVERWKLRLGMSFLLDQEKIEATEEETAQHFEHFIGQQQESETAQIRASFAAKEDVFTEMQWRARVQKLITLFLERAAS